MSIRMESGKVDSNHEADLLVGFLTGGGNAMWLAGVLVKAVAGNWKRQQVELNLIESSLGGR
ncbi:MAG: hypothetical protein PHP53_24410 [Prolixibacteraceae bacterium]|nr:hypothetical protein [Prolixibacteraceae bacterium]